MNYALVLAGGIGRRMGAGIPKQFIEINGKPIIIYSLEVLTGHPEIDGVFVVCIESWREQLLANIKKFNIPKVIDVLPQGNSRRESSYIGVKAVAKHSLNPEGDIVLIHDAARPMLTADIISRNISDAEKYGGCETVCSMNDTVIRSQGEFTESISDIVPRNELARVQTPQSFKVAGIFAAHEYYRKALDAGRDVPDITDDAGLMLFCGRKVKLTEGSSLNIKLTAKEDIAFFKAVINSQGE